MEQDKAERVRRMINQGPFPGMSDAFDRHIGVAAWTDPEFRQEASLWGSAWRASAEKERRDIDAFMESNTKLRDERDQYRNGNTELLGLLMRMVSGSDIGSEAVKILLETGLADADGALNWAALEDRKPRQMTWDEAIDDCISDPVERERIRAKFADDAPEEPCDLCDDCPPIGYPTDKTRCLPCPRRADPGPGEPRAIVVAPR